VALGLGINVPRARARLIGADLRARRSLVALGGETRREEARSCSISECQLEIARDRSGIISREREIPRIAACVARWIAAKLERNCARCSSQSLASDVRRLSATHCVAEDAAESDGNTILMQRDALRRAMIAYAWKKHAYQRRRLCSLVNFNEIERSFARAKSSSRMKIDSETADKPAGAYTCNLDSAYRKASFRKHQRGRRGRRGMLRVSSRLLL